MNNKVDLRTRLRFRDWLRGRLRGLEFYTRRGDHYLIREFAKYCVEHGAPIDEASLGRYLRDDGPVLPTPERCRALARVLDMPPIQVLIEAGYFAGNDLFLPLSKDLSADQLADEAVRRTSIVAQAAQSVSADSPLAILVAQLQLATEQFSTQRAAPDTAPDATPGAARDEATRVPTPVERPAPTRAQQTPSSRKTAVGTGRAGHSARNR